VETYYFAKLRIWENQDERDLACIRMDDPILTGYIERCKAKILGFARRYFGIHGVYAYDGWINIVGDDGKEERLIEIQSLGLIGPHNEWNVAASVAATLPLDIERDSICNTLMNFKGIEHRLEFVRELEGVLFYNDSKSTNPDSLDWALQTFTSSIILIAGGLDKGTDFSFLRNRISEKVKLAILIGKAKEKLKNEWIGATEIIIANSLPDAVELAFENSSPGDIVLLSPGCASFDMFDNFEHRGRVFKELVNKLKSKYEKRT
ncbi:MAG: Mur ligase family protein, partial [bacterium]